MNNESSKLSNYVCLSLAHLISSLVHRCSHLLISPLYALFLNFQS